jgi:hypothetical protein
MFDISMIIRNTRYFHISVLPGLATGSDMVVRTSATVSSIEVSVEK